MDDFSKKSLITFITEGIIFLFGFIALIIITRILGPEGKGIYSLILLVPGLIIGFGNFGISAGNVYFVGSKKYSVKDVASNSIVLSFVLGVFLILIFYLLVQFEFFRKIIQFDRIPSFYLWLVALTIPVSLLVSFFQEIIRGTGQIFRYNKLRLFNSVLGFAFVVFFLVLLGFKIFGAIISYIFTLIGFAIFAVILVSRITDFNFSVNKNLLKDSFIYGGKVYLANMISFLSYRIDMFLLAAILNPLMVASSIGFYSISVSMAEKLFIIPGAISTVLLPRISGSSEMEANNFTPKVVRNTLFVVLLASIVSVFLAKPLIEIVFGSSFTPSVKPFMLLIPGIIAFSIGGVIAADLLGRGKPQFAIYSSIACVVSNIVLNFILIPKWGISGAAIASSIAYWIDTLVVLTAFLIISKNSLSEVLIIKLSDFRDYKNFVFNFRSWLIKK